MKQKNELSTKISTILMQKNLTQKDLADKTGVSQAAISKVLSGKHKTKISTLEKIAKALEVPASILLDDGKKNFIENTGTIGAIGDGNTINTAATLKDHEIRILQLENELLKMKLEKNYKNK